MEKLLPLFLVAAAALAGCAPKPSPQDAADAVALNSVRARFTPEQRQRIEAELLANSDRADQQAQQQIPAANAEEIGKQTALSDNLQAQYDAATCQRYRLSRSDIDALKSEWAENELKKHHS